MDLHETCTIHYTFGMIRITIRVAQRRFAVSDCLVLRMLIVKFESLSLNFFVPTKKKELGAILIKLKKKAVARITGIVNCQNTRDMGSPECNSGPLTFHNK